MKIKVNRASFATDFGFAESAAAKRDVRPIFQYVKLTAQGRSVSLEATDGEVFVRVELNGGCEIEEDGEVALPPKTVKKILAETNDETLVFTTENATTVSIFGETAKFRLATVDPADFPKPQPLIAASARKFGAGFVESAIARTTFAVDAENTHYALGGVCFEIRGNEYFAVATDGRRLAVQRAFGDPNEVGDDWSAIVPLKTLNLILRAFKLDKPDDAPIAVEGGRATFQIGRVFISSVLMEGRFPNWRVILPDKTVRKRVDFVAGTVATAIRQAAVVADEKARDVFLTFESGTLSVTSRGNEIGASSVKLPIAYDGERVETRFDAYFLDEFFRRIKPEGCVSFYFLADKPSVFETDAYSYVVMPLTGGDEKKK